MAWQHCFSIWTAHSLTVPPSQHSCACLHSFHCVSANADESVWSYLDVLGENSFLKCKCSCSCQWGLWLNPVNKKANSSSPLSHPSTRGSDTHILSFAFWGKRVWNMSLNISLWKLSGMYSHTENPFDILRTNNRAIIVNDLRVCVCVHVSMYWRACIGADPGKWYWNGTIHMNGVLPLYNIVGAFSSRRFYFSWILPL